MRRTLGFCITLFAVTTMWLGSALSQGRTLSEQEVVKAAVAQSPDIQRAKYEVQRAEAGLLSARPLLPSRPVLEGDYETGKPFNDPDERLTLGLSQEFEIGGQRSIRRSIAEADIARAEFILHSVERQVGLLSRLLYGRASNLFRQSVLGDSLVATSTRVTEAAHRRLAVGDIAQLEFNAIRLDELRQTSLQERVHAEYESALIELSKLTGIEVDNSVTLMSASPVVSSLTLSLDSIVLLNPELQSQMQEVARLEFERDLAHAQQTPNPTIGVAFSKSTLVIGRDAIAGDRTIVGGIDQIRKTENSLNFKLSLGLPFQFSSLYATGANQVARAEAEIGLARAAQVGLRRRLESRISLLRIQLARLERTATELTEATKLATENDELLERGYIAGELSVSVYLSGRQQLFDAENRSLEVDRDLNAAQAELLSIINQ
ncbi:MAG: TolC family protein [Candidatus Kapaibacterium sp.]